MIYLNKYILGDTNLLLQNKRSYCRHQKDKILSLKMESRTNYLVTNTGFC